MLSVYSCGHPIKGRPHAASGCEISLVERDAWTCFLFTYKILISRRLRPQSSMRHRWFLQCPLQCPKDGRYRRLSQSPGTRPASTAPTSTSTSSAGSALPLTTFGRALPSNAEHTPQHLCQDVERYQLPVPPNRSFPVPTRRRACFHCYLYHPFHKHASLCRLRTRSG